MPDNFQVPGDQIKKLTIHVEIYSIVTYTIFNFGEKKIYTKKVFTVNFWRLVSCEERSESEKEEISLSGWANEGSASSQTGGCGCRAERVSLVSVAAGRSASAQSV